MTLDPDFDLNPSLPDVSNQHTLALKYLDTCPGDTSGRWEATLQSGTVVKGMRHHLAVQREAISACR